MQQQDLRDLTAGHFPGDLLEEREDLVHIAKIVIGNPRGRGCVAVAEGPGVRGCIDELVVVHGDGRDGVAVARQKCFERATRRQIGSDVKEGMTEVSKAPPLRGHQGARDHLASQHVGLKLVERSRVEIAVRVAVVAELESRVQPQAEQADAAVHLVSSRAFDEQLALVHETDGGHAVLLHGAQQLARECLEARHVVGHNPCSCRREIIESDDNGAVDLRRAPRRR